MPRPVTGALLIVGACASATLLKVLWPHLSIILAAVTIALAVGAHGAFFRPQIFESLRAIKSWGQTKESATNIAGHVQNKGIVIGVAFYGVALVVFTIALLALGANQLVLACLTATPFAIMGLATFVWMIMLRVLET